jgi:hypothetical protein
MKREQIAKIRRDNAIKLLRDHGLSYTAFAKKLNKAPSYASMILGEGKSEKSHRNIGSNTARQIEKAFNLDSGELDNPIACSNWQKDIKGFAKVTISRPTGEVMCIEVPDDESYYFSSILNIAIGQLK